MRVLLDLNVLLDVIQRREPHYADSAAVLKRIADGDLSGVVPGHALTTIHYLVSRFAGRDQANWAVDWLLAQMEVVPESRELFLRARSLAFTDFEDAVVVAAAEQTRCDRIVTRNVGDFRGSTIMPLTPRELAAQLDLELGDDAL